MSVIRSISARQRALACLVAACGLLIVQPGFAGTTTTTTSYTYNVDGALTAMTVEDGAGKTTTYLTWDNFKPNANDPASGALSRGNGNLVSLGAQPGGARQFSFDARNRLIGYQETASDPSQSYLYSAENLMRRAEMGSDALTFFYAGAPFRKVVNQKQSATGLTSGRLNAGRYLSDGTEQVLVVPRKDTAALYDPSGNTLQPYDYDPFGAPEEAAPEGNSGYDLAQNPFQYAGEYRDPVWGGYYLRARWYDPALPSFISRDPVQNINRYAYAAGNPVMHVDPGGKDAFGPGSFFWDLNRDLNRGVGGGFARFFLAPLMGPLALMADPKAFWHAIEHNTANIDVFLSLGIASEFLGGIADSYAVRDVVARTRGKRYLWRTLSDLGIGVGQSVSAGARRGWRHFDWKSFDQGMELLGGANLFWRGLYGINVRSGFRTRSSTADLVEEFGKSSPANHDALIFRDRSKVPGGGLGRRILNNLPIPKDAPLLELAGLGAYHDGLVAVEFEATPFGDTESVYSSNAEASGIERHFTAPRSVDSIVQAFRTVRRTYELVGRVSNFDPQTFFDNPLQMGLAPNDVVPPIGGPYAGGGGTGYSWYNNNCHAHATYVLKGMGLR